MSDAVYSKVKGLKEAKEVLNKLCQSYEGHPKTKQARLMNLKQKYECLRMVDDEGVENYIHSVKNIVDAIRACWWKF